MTGDAAGLPSADDRSGSYAKRVGSQLREVRREKRMSLHDVESRSGQEFKASVLGAYERGERAISVPRLQRLADLYLVPVDRLLPPIGGGSLSSTGPDATARPRPGARLTFDLEILDGIDDAQLNMVKRFVANVRGMRKDFEGRELTVRQDDVRTIAGLFGVEPSALVSWLERYRAPAPK